VNQAVSNKANSIWGMKFMIQMTAVLTTDFLKVSLAKIDLKFSKGSERKVNEVRPRPLRSVKPIITV
jgi:hypothetical protein